MKILSWKFDEGKGHVVKYETRGSVYTLKTKREPRKQLYDAAKEVVDEIKVSTVLLIPMSFSGISISSENRFSASITLNVLNLLNETAELKIPKINLSEDADLHQAIDVFLKEVEAFVKQQYEEEMSLFHSIPDVSLSISAAEMDSLAQETA